jgi:hypothetical protein
MAEADQLAVDVESAWGAVAGFPGSISGWLQTRW